MKRDELIKMMQELECDGSSELNMRSESIQNGQRVSRIPSLKKKLKKKSKLLLICELAIPFDPETGEVGQYNKDRKWRPPFSATSVAKVLKGNADANEKLKDILMRRAGLTEWDTSNCDEINNKDRAVFMPYRVPRIFTVPVVSVNIPAMSGNRDYSRDYAIDVQYDDKTGQIVGEKPIALKAYDLFNDVAYEEISELEEKIAKGELVLTEQQVADKKADIRKKICVSNVHPANYVTAIEIPMTAKLDVSQDFTGSAITKEGITDAVVLSKLTKKMRTALDEYAAGNWERFDYSLDYVEIDMACPTEGDENSSMGKQQIGLNTTYDKPAMKLIDCADFNKIESSIIGYLDDCVDIEQKVYRSTYIYPYNDEVEDKICQSLHTVLDIENNKYVTQSVLQKNAEIVSMAFGEAGQDLLLDIQSDVSDKDVGRLGDGSGAVAAATEAKEYDLDSEDFAGDLEEVNPDFSE